jgi:hypothetical protein
MQTTAASEPLLHIIIPTFRRPLKLERLLASLEQQGYVTGDNLRITVSENGGSAGADAIVARWQERLPISYVQQPAPLGCLLHLAVGYAQSAGTYCWLIGDDDVITDAPWPAMRAKLAPGELDTLLLGHDFVAETGAIDHDPGTKHLERMPHKHRGDGLDLVCTSPFTAAFLSAAILRTTRVKAHLAHCNFSGGYVPLELTLRVAAGGIGEYWAGNRVRGDLAVSWGASAPRYHYYDLPEMLARLARELPPGPIEEAIVAIFRDGLVNWPPLVAYDRDFALWLYRRHGLAIERGVRLAGGRPALHELYRYASISGHCKEIAAVGWIRVKELVAGAVSRLGKPRSA